jgi:hypothetical protein
MLSECQHLKSKSYPTSLAIREMQIQTAVRSHFTPTRMTIIKNKGNSKCWWGCRETGTLVITGRNAKCCSHFGKWAVSLKVKHIVYFFFFFETVFYYVAQADTELMSLLNGQHHHTQLLYAFNIIFKKLKHKFNTSHNSIIRYIERES